LGYRIRRGIAPREPAHLSGAAYAGRSKIEILLGPDVWNTIPGRTVIDFGCGNGADTIELAQHGARHAYGVDINERCLERARQKAAAARCSNVTFASTPTETADLIVSLDAFEHFADPASILAVMASMLKPTGYVLAAFGPTWYHPLGGHLFSVFPWAHLLFSEAALCRWRSQLRGDGAQRFSEVEGGL
jgi:ubiquinone/menaquinone biosynthesis C-methylase UbiE